LYYNATGNNGCAGFWYKAASPVLAIANKASDQCGKESILSIGTCARAEHDLGGLGRPNSSLACLQAAEKKTGCGDTVMWRTDGQYGCKCCAEEDQGAMDGDTKWEIATCQVEKSFYIHFHSEFKLVPPTQCSGQYQNEEPPLTPRAIQMIYKFFANQTIGSPPTLSNGSIGYSDAAINCHDDQSCKSYTWPCAKDSSGKLQCPCLPAYPDCKSKFPTNSSYSFYDVGEYYMQHGGDLNIFVKQAQIPGNDDALIISI